MRRMILIGRSGAGKTTLAQALLGTARAYHKTQSVTRDGWLIDTPGEYMETNTLGHALAVFTYEADLVGLLLSAVEPYSLYPPGVTAQANREVIGMVTHIDAEGADPARAERWLRLAGCQTVFRVSAVTGEGLDAVRAYLQRGGQGAKPQESSANPS